MSDARERSLGDQLPRLLRMAGARPARWIASVIVVSLVLTTLDTLGVAAMIPLTQLISGTATDTGALGAIAEITGISEPSELVPIVAAAIAGLFIFKSVASIVFRWWLLGRTSRISALVATDLMRRYMLSPYVAHRGRHLAEVYRNINESTAQAASVLQATITVLTDAMLLIAIIAVLAITAPWITLLVVFVFGLLLLGIQLGLRRRQARLGEEIADAGLAAWSFLMPGLDGFRETRLSSSAGSFIDGYRAAKLRGAMAGRQLALVSEAPRYALEIGFVLAIAGISVVLFATGTPAEALTVLGVFGAASLRALPTLNRVASSLATIRSGQVGLRIVLRAGAELDGQGRHEEAPRSDEPFEGDISFIDVGFRYPDADEDVLRGITLTIPRNRTVAFVGSSGAGKSTLLDLLLGLLEPTHGRIECGGRSILDDRARWYADLGVVPQDVFLVNDTLRANVAFGVPSEAVDADRVSEVVAMARLEGLVAELPRGLDTMVGERGVRLSGGQRQRLGLARALYRRPSVLVLDEATSSLDNVTEFEITDTLKRLEGTMTIVIVAHRLSTVRGADHLVFLDKGLIEAQGTFPELRSRSAAFNRLVELGDLS
ncbi:ABC transporter ATP-binding protein [Microbacterium awajiense]|uniref:ABC transporter ATP-binding protein n=1 Tax=Microbacterium awajiense TaxID=415214 RepID=A0ABP7AMB2_9MICO